MEPPQTVRLSKDVVHEMMNIIFEMRPSETYVNLVQTLLSDAPEIGSDYLVPPELDVLLSPSKVYLRSPRQAASPEQTSGSESADISAKNESEDVKPTYDILSPPNPAAFGYGEPASSSNAPSSEPIQCGLRENSNISGSVHDPSLDRDKYKSSGANAPTPEQVPTTLQKSRNIPDPAPGIFLDGVEYKSSREQGYNTLESILRYMGPPEPIDTKPYIQNNTPFHYLSHIDSVWNPRESLLDQNERRTLNKKDFIDSIAYDKAMKNMHPNMDVWAKERKAYDMVWTSGWANQTKEMKGKQVMSENGKGFLEFGMQ